MSDMTIPETTVVKLFNGTTFTRHEYVATEEVECKPQDGKPGGIGFAFMFRCTSTGKIRRFGLEQAV